MTSRGRLDVSATSSMNAMVRDMVAAGRSVVALTSGEPQGLPPRHVRAAAAAASIAEVKHGYGPIEGEFDLRVAIADAQGGGVGPEHVVVTSGVKHALFTVFLGSLEPGDRVLVPTPNWPTYQHSVAIAGGRPVPVRTDPRQGFRLRAEDLERVREAGATMLLLGIPANPTGAVPTPADLRQIGDWCARHGIRVVLDQVYEPLTWAEAGVRPYHVLRRAGADVVAVDGVSKSYRMPGWRVGWLIADDVTVKASTAVLSHTTNHASRIPQAAALAALTGDQSDLAQLRRQLLRNRDVVKDLLGQSDLVDLGSVDGTFYAFPSFSRFLNASRRFKDSTELAKSLLGETGVAVMPGAVFGAPEHARLSFAQDSETLEAALSTILDFLRVSA